jgi:hypothetical protein
MWIWVDSNDVEFEPTFLFKRRIYLVEFNNERYIKLFTDDSFEYKYFQ